jgi:cation transport protein ChaC
MWIFGYGSLIFRPGFPFIERRRAFVAGWARRFWQASPDHRGLPEAPGLVVTLVEAPGETCGGSAYRIDVGRVDPILAELDAREQAGFERRALPLSSAPGGVAFGEGVAYVGSLSNAHFAGPLGDRDIAERIQKSRGPSGTNVDYVLRLADALRALDIADPHVEAIARLVR